MEGDADQVAFRFYSLLSDFQRSTNFTCKISHFENDGTIMTARGTELICGNRELKMVSMDFSDGQRGIAVSELLRK